MFLQYKYSTCRMPIADLNGFCFVVIIMIFGEENEIMALLGFFFGSCIFTSCTLRDCTIKIISNTVKAKKKKVEMKQKYNSCLQCDFNC